MSRFPSRTLSVPLGLLLGCAEAPVAPEHPSPLHRPPQSTATDPASDTATPSAESRAAAAPEPKGARPPDFELETLNGDSVRLSDHLGKDVILIDFWATFCGPCLLAMPHLEELYQRHKDQGFVVLGVSIDGPDSLAQVRAEVRKLGVTFPILLDTETSVVQRYNPKTSAPYSVLIDRSGRVIKKKEGYSTGDGAGLDQDVANALDRR